MPSGRFQGYDPVDLQHPDMDRPIMRQTFSSDTARSTQLGDYDGKSFQSNSPLGPSPTYPPLPSQSDVGKHVRMPDEAAHRSPSEYDAEQGRGYEGLPYGTPPQNRPPNHRGSSWDLLAGVKKFEHSYEEFDSRHASESHLTFAEGDIPKNKVNACNIIWDWPNC